MADRLPNEVWNAIALKVNGIAHPSTAGFLLTEQSTINSLKKLRLVSPRHHDWLRPSFSKPLSFDLPKRLMMAGWAPLSSVRLRSTHSLYVFCDGLTSSTSSPRLRRLRTGTLGRIIGLANGPEKNTSRSPGWRSSRTWDIEWCICSRV